MLIYFVIGAPKENYGLNNSAAENHPSDAIVDIIPFTHCWSENRFQVRSLISSSLVCFLKS